MKKRTISGAMLALLLVDLLMLTLNVQPVKTSGTIYIRADGSVEPSTAPISTVDNIVYVFANNIYDEIVVERNNIIIDGKGYTLQGAGSGDGFCLHGANNVTIRNVNIVSFGYGVNLNSSSMTTICENNITNNHYCIRLLSSSRTSIIGNDIVNSWGGISFFSSSNNNIISGNNITANNDYGIRFQSSSSNNSIIGNNVANNYYGVWLDSSVDNAVSGNNITDNDYGIRFHSSSNNNTIIGNNVANGWGGISLFSSSSKNIILGNNITNNARGVWLDPSSNNNIISGNKIAENWCGIWFFSSFNNRVSGNDITNNDYGLRFHSSSNNLFFHNNLVDNAHQLEGSGCVNFWDNNYPSGGNYWSDHADIDKSSGSYQNETGGDGIVDVPNVIDENNTDNYPLMGMFTDFLVTSELHAQAICDSTIVDFQFSYGESEINLNVTGEYGTIGFCRICVPTALLNVPYRVFVNNTEIPYRLLPLSNGTHNYLYFNYGVWSFGDLYSDREIDMRDITYAARAFGSYPSHPRWNPLCDFSVDYEVDLADLVLVAKNFGKTY